MVHLGGTRTEEVELHFVARAGLPGVGELGAAVVAYVDGVGSELGAGGQRGRGVAADGLAARSESALVLSGKERKR